MTRRSSHAEVLDMNVNADLTAVFSGLAQAASLHPILRRSTRTGGMGAIHTLNHATHSLRR